MRKAWFILLLFCYPLPSMAQRLHLEDSMHAVIGLIQSPILMIIAMIAALIAGFIALTGRDSASRDLGLTVFMSAMMVPVFRMLTSMLGIELPPEPEKQDEKPGMLAESWHWMMDHAGTIALAIGLLALAGLLVNRSMSKKSKKRRVKVELAELLETIERVDLLLLYWQNTTLSATNETKRYAASTIEKLKKIQLEILVQLEQVHSGTPLDDSQRTALDKHRTAINACMKDDIGTPIKVAAGMKENAGSEHTVAVDKQVAIAAGKGRHRKDRQAEATTAAASSHTSLTDDLLNPLHPLSPLSPWSVWKSDSDHHQGSHRQTETRERDQYMDSAPVTSRTSDTSSMFSDARFDVSSSSDSGNSSSFDSFSSDD